MIEKVKKLPDIPPFIEWMVANEGKSIPEHYRLIILLNIVNSYDLLNGDLNLNRVGTKRQIQLMWEYIVKYRKNK